MGKDSKYAATAVQQKTDCPVSTVPRASYSEPLEADMQSTILTDRIVRCTEKCEVGGHSSLTYCRVSSIEAAVRRFCLA